MVDSTWVDEYNPEKKVKTYCVVPENIHTPPTEGIFHMTPPLPSGFSKNGPQTIPLPRSGNSNFFLHPLEILFSISCLKRELAKL